MNNESGKPYLNGVDMRKGPDLVDVDGADDPVIQDRPGAELLLREHLDQVTSVLSSLQELLDALPHEYQLDTMNRPGLENFRLDNVGALRSEVINLRNIAAPLADSARHLLESPQPTLWTDDEYLYSLIKEINNANESFQDFNRRWVKL